MCGFRKVEDTEALLVELTSFIDKEAKASKEFYERQMKETPTFDDSFKENMVKGTRPPLFFPNAWGCLFSVRARADARSSRLVGRNA